MLIGKTGCSLDWFPVHIMGIIYLLGQHVDAEGEKQTTAHHPTAWKCPQELKSFLISSHLGVVWCICCFLHSASVFWLSF